MPRQAQKRVIRNRITELRTEEGWTQEELAEKLGKSRGLITQWETGHTRLTEDAIYELAEVFKTTPGRILIGPASADDLLDQMDSETREAALRHLHDMANLRKP